MAAETSSSSSTRSLQDTPTWAVATVCFCFILVYIILEHTIHLISNWLKKRKKKSLVEAVDKLKSELMLLGFISFILAVLHGPISSICISTKYADIMLPCRKSTATHTGQKLMVTHEYLKKTANPFHFDNATYDDGPILHLHRRLASSSSNSTTCANGKVSLVSQEGLHQLHILIFVLAANQLVYSLLTMALGRAKMRHWKAWEEETQTISYQVANDPERFRLTRETTFARRHLSIWTEYSTVLLWFKCFFRQFFHSVEKVDYLTLRHGFIKAHIPNNNNFNFQKYIQRSLEDDFKVVVGISPPMWLIVIIFLLANLNGLHIYRWIAYVPMIMVLVLGTKLEVILVRMALQLKDQTAVVKGAPLVLPDDNLFWFNKPRLVLHLLHATMFVNSFELAFSLWATWQFGFKSCYHDSPRFEVGRMVMAMIVQVISSYITLPIYALVTQMGSQYKGAILKEQTKEVVRLWYERVKKKKKQSSSHQSLFCHPNSEMGSSRETSPMEISAPPTLRPFGQTTSSPWDEIREVEDEPGEVVVELSELRGVMRHPPQFRKHC